MKHNPLLGAAVGAAGGLLGAGMMVLFQHVVGGTQDQDDDRPHRRAEATPNNTDGTFPDEPATIQAAEAVSRDLFGHEPSDREKQLGGSALHYAFGAAMGALYGLAAEVQPRTTAAAGLPFGTAVWLAADEVGVPLAGFAGKPTDYPVSRHAAALASHLVFGLTVEGVRRALLGRAYSRE
ncbi:MAG TPA: DUF1440 domain-containing protein [Vicinamibacterales bacterium]